MIVLNEFSNGFFIAKLIAKVKDEVVIVIVIVIVIVATLL